MKILFTGSSSFTGFWFVRELAQAGHDVTAILRQAPGDYAPPIRRRRVECLASICRLAPGCSFGDEAFLKLAAQPGWDVLCHHAADVTDYKSPFFDVPAALASNTRHLPAVLEALKNSGCQRVVLTGSVFENGEGAGSDGLPAFSPYGLSKAMTAQMFQYQCSKAGLSLGKFVISNPFGPFEEPRFTAYLMKNWFAGQRPAVNTPAYIRDNIHVSLLARSYVSFVNQLPAQPGYRRLSPSGYIESQGAFARRFAGEMRQRLGLACELELREQTDFSEPFSRTNTDPPDTAALGWNETQAWNGIAEFYRQELGASVAVR